MAKFHVRGELVKGNTSLGTSKTVEAESEVVAIELARQDAYRSHPSCRDREWRLKSVDRR